MAYLRFKMLETALASATVAASATVSESVAALASVAEAGRNSGIQTVATVAAVANHALDCGIWDAADLRESYEERAAIMEYEAGMSRADAEAAAWADVFEGCRTVDHRSFAEPVEWSCGDKCWAFTNRLRRLRGIRGNGFDASHRSASQWYVSFRWGVAKTGRSGQHRLLQYVAKAQEQHGRRRGGLNDSGIQIAKDEFKCADWTTVPWGVGQNCSQHAD
jgi:hypothetical protein